MSLPGFSAERGLYRSTAHYGTFDFGEGTQSLGQAVLPAGTPNPCTGVVCGPGKKCIVSTAWLGGFKGPVAGCVEIPPTITCPSGQSGCRGTDGLQYCADLQSDVNQCGTCDNSCDPNQICVKGNCVCNSPSLTNCGAVDGCTDLTSDPYNCGRCGHRCRTGHNCCDGKCCSATCCGTDCTHLATDPDNCGTCGKVCPTGQTCFKGCCIVPPTPPLSGTVGALDGSGNYTLYSPSGAGGCQPIHGLKVSFAVNKNMSAAASARGGPPLCSQPIDTTGFTVQLNAASKSLWQQYVFLVGQENIVGQVQYWGGCAKEVVNLTTNSLLPGNDSLTSNIIPENYVLEIQLHTDHNGNVISATFTVTDDSHNKVSQKLPIPALYQGPALAFQVDVGGPDNCSYAGFTSGAASITYKASSSLCVTGALPVTPTGKPAVGCSSSNCNTAETSNVTFAPISTCCGLSLTQEVNTPGG